MAKKNRAKRSATVSAEKPEESPASDPNMDSEEESVAEENPAPEQEAQEDPPADEVAAEPTEPAVSPPRPTSKPKPETRRADTPRSAAALQPMFMVRLKEHNPKRHFKHRTIDVMGREYVAGEGGNPSDIWVMPDGKEIARLEQLNDDITDGQFDIREVSGVGEVKKIIAREFENRVRDGGRSVRARLNIDPRLRG